MRPLVPFCSVLLLLASSSAQDDFNSDSSSTGQPKHGNLPPSSFQIGPVDVQTGPNWSVNVFDFIKIKRRPNGGVDVSVQAPDAIFSRSNDHQEGNFGDPSVQHFKRRRRNTETPSAKSLHHDLQDGESVKVVFGPNSVASANEEKETTFRIGNFSITTGKNWSLELGKLKIKARPGGGIDVKMDPSPNQTPGGNGGNPYEDPSVQHFRKRRSLGSWIYQEDLPEEYPRKRRSVKSWISKKAQLSEEDPRVEYSRKRRSLENWISKITQLTKEATDSILKNNYY